MLRFFLSVTFFFVYTLCYCQDTKIFTGNDDSKYFDFWEGTWHRVMNDKPDTAKTMFKVMKGNSPFSFVEDWRMVLDSGQVIKANAVRSWDKINSRWMYVWVSDNALFQVWDGTKVDGNWYIQREFEINGDKFLSRQAWIPTGENTLMRIGERSHDNGKTWQLRYKEFYQKDAGKNPDDENLLRQCLNNYMFGDSAKFTSAFHPSTFMKFIDPKTNQFRDVPIADYLNGAAPLAGKPTTVKKRIVTYRITGNAAQAELEMRRDNFITHDYMNLLKIGNEWKIVNKIFWREEIAISK